MSRAGSGAFALALVALVGILAGCAASPAVQLTNAERARMRIGLADSRWATVNTEFQDADRPAVAVRRTVDDHAWAQAIAECLQSAGYSVQVIAGSYHYLDDVGHSPMEFAVANYSCVVAYPSISSLIPFLGRGQIDALYLYYVASVRPCLLAAGAPTGAPPTRFAFVTSVLSRQSWHPFERVWAAGLPTGQVRYLELLCPPVPEWLDLGTGPKPG